MTSTDELDLLRASARAVFSSGKPDALAQLGELGLLGLLVPEAAGGMGWCPVEAAVVADEAGRAAAVGGVEGPGATGATPPWASTTVGAAALAAADVEGAVLVRALAGDASAVAVAAGQVHIAPGGDEVEGVLVGVEGADRTDALAVLVEAPPGPRPGAVDGGVTAGRPGPRPGGTSAGDEAARRPSEVAAVGEPADGAPGAVVDTPSAGAVGAGAVAVVVVDLTGPGVRLRPEPVSLDTTRPLVRVELSGARVLAEGDAGRVLAAARTLAAAEVLGSLRAAVERLVPYLSERRAFGAPIASFQALQHRIVDLALLEQRAGVLVDAAARALAVEPASAGPLANAAFALVADQVPPAVDECIQLTGGIGFTWEYPLHHELRRSVGSATGLGSARSSRRRTGLDRPGGVRSLLATPGVRPAEASLDAFREHVRQVIAEHAPSLVAREGHRAPTSPAEEQALRRWFRAMYEHGLVGADWPVEHGGSADHDPRHGPIVQEEVLRARAPRPVDQTGLAAALTLRFGTPAQQATHLPRIRRGDAVWCQLLSEPDAGSDIANVRTRAVAQPDGTFVVDGQKTWITDGHWADWGVGLFRTDPDSTRHHGLTMFYVPMDAPGVEVRPILTMGGAVDVNEVFFDGVELTSDHVIDEVGAGWKVIMTGLDLERFGIGGNVVLLDLLHDDLVTVVAHLELDGSPATEADDVAQRVAELGLEAAVGALVVDDHVARTLAGADEPGSAAVAKIGFAEAYHRISAYGCRLAASGVLAPAGEDALGRLQDAWLWSRAYTISGGSSEMMRNILAKRRLRLPTA